jgi:hypothetical protein
MLSSSSGKPAAKSPNIWWTNAFFFVSVHLAAVVGAFYRPPSAVERATLAMAFVLWQLGSFGYVCVILQLYTRSKFPGLENNIASLSVIIGCTLIVHFVLALASALLWLLWVLLPFKDLSR